MKKDLFLHKKIHHTIAWKKNYLFLSILFRSLESLLLSFQFRGRSGVLFTQELPNQIVLLLYTL